MCIRDSYTIDNAFPFFSIGHFDTEETVTIRMSFPENSTVSFDVPEFFALDLDQYTQAIASIRQQEVAIHKKKNKLVAAYNANRDTTLIFTLPYDKGWSAKQNGKPIKIHRIQKGLMGVRVSKGSGTVTLTFVPQGFIEAVSYTHLMIEISSILNPPILKFLVNYKEKLVPFH